MINSDSGKTKGTANGSTCTGELIANTHNIMNKKAYSYKAAYKAVKSIKGAAKHLSVGTDEVVRCLVRSRNGTQSIKGRFPDCVRGISSIAGDCQGTIISVKKINHDPAKGHEQQFFYSYL